FFFRPVSFSRAMASLIRSSARRTSLETPSCSFMSLSTNPNEIVSDDLIMRTTILSPSRNVRFIHSHRHSPQAQSHNRSTHDSLRYGSSVREDHPTGAEWVLLEDAVAGLHVQLHWTVRRSAGAS